MNNELEEMIKIDKEIQEKYNLTPDEYNEAVSTIHSSVYWKKNNKGELPSAPEMMRTENSMKASVYAGIKKKKLLDNKS